jgi:hypothetical protein
MMHVAHLIAHTYVGLGTHTGIFPPAIPPIPTAPHIAVDTLLGLTLGANYSNTVKGPFGIQLVGKGNDSGKFVPHIAIAPHPGNILIPLIIAFGSSKPMFCASTVHIGNMAGGNHSTGPVAANPIPYNFVSINQACNDPCNYPSDMVISPNTVVVGLTLGDFIGGLVRIAVDSAVSFAASALGGKVAGVLMKQVYGRIAQQVIKEFTAELTEKFGKEAAESMTRDAVENILEGYTAQFIKTLLSKMAGGEITPFIEGSDNFVTQQFLGVDKADAVQMGVDGQIPISSLTEPGAPLANEHPGAPPIHHAE